MPLKQLAQPILALLRMKNSSSRIYSLIGLAISGGVVLTLCLMMFITLLASYRSPAEKQNPLLVVNLVSQTKSKNQEQAIKKTSSNTTAEKPKPPKSKPKKSQASVAEKVEPIAKKPEKIVPAKKPMLVEEKIIPLEEAEPLTPDPQSPVMDAKPDTNALPIPTPMFQLTQGPRFLHKEPPIYPETMRSNGTTGVVKLEALIDQEGRVRKVKVLKSAGEYFDQSAKRALLASSFLPAKIDDKPVAVLLRLPVRYRLN